MNCEEYRAMISCALDGELSEEEQSALNSHLEKCEDCRSYRDALLELSEELRTPVEPPKALRERVMGSVQTELRRRKIRVLSRYGSLAACAVLLLSLSILPRLKTAKEAEAPMLMASGTADSAAAADTWTETYAVAEAAAAPMSEPIPEPEEANGGLMFANSFVLPDPETVARDFLWERNGTEYGECSVEILESAGDYDPVLEDYEPVGEITAVRFENVTVLVDETARVFGLEE